jgi:inhibitor of cysteine peptidase
MRRIRVLATGVVATIAMLTINLSGINAEWRQDSIGYWYSQDNSCATSWKQIDGVWYYFDDNGYMKKGWLFYNNNWYFLDSNGAMKTGIIQVDGKTYYLGESGEMKTGGVTIAGESYNFANSGEAMDDKIPQADKAFSGTGIPVPLTQVKNQLKCDGKTVIISLDGNPTTGHTWQYHVNQDDIIKEESKQYKQDNDSIGLDGAGGTYTWIFSALKEGTAEITFEYLRPWEKQLIKTKTYICTVDKDLKITIKEKN